MKSKATLRLWLLAAGSSLSAISSAYAVTYTWTQNATGSQSWTTATNWSGSNIFVSDPANELTFSFTGVAGNATVVTDIPTTLSMNVLTLAGTGPNSTSGSSILIGDNTSTWTIGDGTTSTVNLSSGVGGGTNDRDIRYTIAANLQLSGGTGGITTFTGNSPSITGAVFSGNITETASGKGITKSGSSLLIFSGNNSYTGTTTVSAGTLRLNSANALSGGLGATGGTSALTINGGVVELGAGNFLRNVGTGSSQFQITGGTSGFSARGGPRVISVNNDASQELVWGSASFAPTTLVLNAASANNSLELTNKIDLAAATRTVQVNADKALLSGDIRTASGTAGLTKAGAGALVLTGNNTYNGNTTITAGTLSVETTNNLGSGSASLIMNGGTLQITGTTLTSISGIGHTVSFANNAKGFDIHNAANTFTVDQVLSGTTFTKSGVGTLVLNQDNTISGATTVTGGGTLVLDYSTNNGTKIANAALNLNGGNLVLRGGSGGKSVTSIVLGAGTGNSISRDGSSTATIANAGGLTGGNLTIAEAGIVSTTSANVNGIQTLGNVTVGSDFATRDGSNLLQAYSSYTGFTAGAGGGSGSVVNQLTGGGTMTGGLSSYSLKIANSGSSDVLNLGVNNLNLTNGGTVLYAGGSSDSYTINGTGAVRPVSSNQSMTVNVFAGTLTVNALLNTGGSGTVAKAGIGTLVAGGASAYGGATYVQQGVLRAANATALGGTGGGVIVQGGAALELSQTTALTPADITIGAEALSITGTGISNEGALRNHSGSNTYQGAITIGASGARINANASSTLTLTGGIATTLTQDVTFGGAGNINVNTAAISGSGGLVKDGAGNTTLNFTNSYSGLTRIDNGTLTLGHATNTLANTGAVNVNGGILALGSNTDTVGAVILTSGSITGSGAGTLTGTSYDVRSGTISAKLGNSLAALTKTTAGTVILSGENSYTGITTISAGTLEIWSTLASSGIVNNAALIFDNALSQSYLNAISGSGTFTKKGAGMLTLSAANTYTGATQVTGGVLNIASTGSTDVNSAVTVSNSGSAIIVNGTLGGSLLADAGTTVSGSGTITGNTTISGIHSPGNSPGIQTYASNLTYSGGSSVVNWELNDDTSTNLANPDAIFDQIIVGGNLSFSGSTALNLVFNGSGSAVNWSDAFWDSNQSWTLYDVAGNTENFVNLNLNISDWLDSGGNLFSTTGGSFSLGQSGQDVVLNYVIPEPGAALLGGLGVLLLLRRRR